MASTACRGGDCAGLLLRPAFRLQCIESLFQTRIAAFQLGIADAERWQQIDHLAEGTEETPFSIASRFIVGPAGFRYPDAC